VIRRDLVALSAAITNTVDGASKEEEKEKKKKKTNEIETNSSRNRQEA